MAFPVAEGLFGRILGTSEGKVLYLSFPMQGALDRPIYQDKHSAKGVLLTYNFDDRILGERQCELEVEVTDNVGNTSRYEATVFRR